MKINSNQKSYPLELDSLGSIVIVIFVIGYLFDHLNIGSGFVLPIVGFYGYLFLVKPYAIINKPNMDNLKILSFVLLMFSLHLVSSIHKGMFPIRALLTSISYLGISIMLLKAKINDKIIDLLFIGVISFFTIHIIIGTDPNNIFVTSRNSVSMFTILCTALVMIVKSKNGKKISPLYVTANLLICIWAVGRSGIISSFILFVGYFISYFRDNKNNIKNYLIILSVTILSSALLFIISPTIFNPVVELFQVSLDKFFNQGLNDPVRKEMIYTYMDAISSDKYDFLFGVDLSIIPIFMRFDGNPHNSYLRLHSKYGIIGLTLVSVLMIKAAIQLLKKNDYMQFSCLIAISMRIFTDISAFWGMFDIIIFYYIFEYVFCYNRHGYVYEYRLTSRPNINNKSLVTFNSNNK